MISFLSSNFFYHEGDVGGVATEVCNVASHLVKHFGYKLAIRSRISFKHGCVIRLRVDNGSVG